MKTFEVSACKVTSGHEILQSVIRTWAQRHSCHILCFPLGHRCWFVGVIRHGLLCQGKAHSHRCLQRCSLLNKWRNVVFSVLPLRPQLTKSTTICSDCSTKTAWDEAASWVYKYYFWILHFCLNQQDKKSFLRSCTFQSSSLPCGWALALLPWLPP